MEFQHTTEDHFAGCSEISCGRDMLIVWVRKRIIIGSGDEVYTYRRRPVSDLFTDLHYIVLS